MKKSLSLLVCATALIGLSQLASATATSTDVPDNQQYLDGQAPTFNANDPSMEINVNGTLGVDNTDPNAPIDPTVPVDPNDPNGDQKPNPEWINVTVPITTVFHNTIDNPTIISPQYKIINNSGRPVDVSVGSFKLKDGSSLPTVTKNNFDLYLNLESTSTKNIKQQTQLVNDNQLVSNFSGNIITLANNEGKQTANGAVVADSCFATYTYGGSAAVTSIQKSQYTLNLKFTAVTTAFDGN